MGFRRLHLTLYCTSPHLTYKSPFDIEMLVFWKQFDTDIYLDIGWLKFGLRCMITAHVTCLLSTVTDTLDTQPFFNQFDTTYNLFIRFISIELHLIPVVLMFLNLISDAFQNFKVFRLQNIYYVKAWGNESLGPWPCLYNQWQY